MATKIERSSKPLLRWTTESPRLKRGFCPKGYTRAFIYKDPGIGSWWVVSCLGTSDGIRIDASVDTLTEAKQLAEAEYRACFRPASAAGGGTK